MKKYEHNPRTWTKKQIEQLRKSMLELGDLSGIVHDLNSDQIIGGNFRSEIMDVNKCDIELVEQFEEPTPQGTVGIGFITWNGERFAYRQVRWTKEQCDRACISANAMGGDFDYDELANYFAEYDLEEFGLDLWKPEEPSSEESPAPGKEDKIQITIEFASIGERERFLALMKQQIETDYDCSVSTK